MYMLSLLEVGSIFRLTFEAKYYFWWLQRCFIKQVCFLCSSYIESESPFRSVDQESVFQCSKKKPHKKKKIKILLLSLSSNQN